MPIFHYQKPKPVFSGEYKKSDLAMPSGAVFDAPLASNASSAETGQTLNISGTPVYGAVDGIPCVTLDGTTTITFSDAGFPTGTSARTMACWVKVNSFVNGYHAVVWGYGGGSMSKYMCLEMRTTGAINCGGYEADLETDSGLWELGKWYHVAVTKDGNTETIYLDGIAVKTGTTSKNTSLGTGLISGIPWAGGVHLFNGSLAACRIYNRVLTDAEILNLSQEFTAAEIFGETSTGFDDMGFAVPYYAASLAECNIVRIPKKGLAFYAPLAEAKTAAETGQSIGSGGQYKVVKGIPCLWLDYDRVDVGMDNFPTGGETYTASMWMCADYEQGYSEPVYAFIWGRDASGCNANFRYDPQSGYAYIAGGYDNQITSNEPVAGKWSHLLFTFDKGTFTAYQDGKFIGTSVNPSFDIGTAGARIGISLGGGHYYRGGVAAIRIYNRVLSEYEITKLAGEFTEHLNPVFYASLKSASNTAETGQALIARNVTYETVDGIQCAYFDGNATIYMPDNDENILRLPRYKMPGTISLWFKSTAAQYASIMNYCGENRTSRGIWLNDSGNITLDDGGGNLSDTVGFCDDVNHFNGNWCHALITYNGTTLKLYVDGIEKSSVDYELNTGAMRFGIGAWAWGHITHYFTGYVAAVRVYDRVVTAEEIQQLAGEFDV